MDPEPEHLLRLREAKLLEWVFVSPGAFRCAQPILDMLTGFARRLLILQTSRREICDILPPARQRKLSIAECAVLNAHINAFYLQLVKGLENLTRALEAEFTNGEATDQPNLLRLNLRDSIPALATSLESSVEGLTEVHETRNPCRLSHPLYVLPAAAEGAELETLERLEEELSIAARAGDFREYRQKIGEAQQFGDYFPLLASRSGDRIHRWPLPQQVVHDAEILLSVAESIFFVFEQRTA